MSLFALPAVVFADAFFTGVTDQNWNTGVNWNPNPPGSQNYVVTNDTGNYPVLSAASAFTPVDLFIGNGAGISGRLDQSAGTLALANTGVNGNWMFVGANTGTGTYNLTGSGSLAVGKLWVGGFVYGENGTGTVNINTTGSVVANSTDDFSGFGQFQTSISVGWGSFPSGTGNGTLNLINGTIYSTNRAIYVGAWGSTGTLNQSGGTIYANGLSLGRWFNQNATVTVSNGTLNTAFVDIGRTGNGSDTAQGTLTVNSNGIVNCEGDLVVGAGGSGSSVSTLTINTGAVVNVASTIERWTIVGQNGANNATVTIDGGTLNLNANTDLRFTAGNNTGAGVINLNSGAITGGAGSLLAFNSGNVAANNVFNLNGGTLTIGQIITGGPGGTRDFNFNGGTLKASASSASFFATGVAGSATVQAGGAIIDTAGFNITIGQNLLDGGTGGGLTKNGNGTLALNGADTYTGGTVVNAGAIGGSGSIASLVTVNSGAGINLTDGVGATLTLANGLTLSTGNALTFEAGSSVDQVAITGGTYTAPTTAATVNIVAIPGLTPGTYPLITGASGISLSSFTLAGSAATGFAYALQVTGSSLELVVTAVAPIEAFWKGGVNGLWNASDSGALFNWATSAAGTSSTVTKPSTPTAVTFSAAGAASQNTTLGENFTVKSVSFNASAGSVTIAASGSEVLTINGSVTNNSANAQTFTAPVTFNGNQAIVLNGAGNVAFNGPVTFNGNQTNTASGATLALNGAVTNTTKLTVDGATNTTISGAVTGAGGLTKVGNGTLTLSGTYAATGFFQVNAGKAILAGSTTPANDLSIGEGTGTSGTLNITTGGSVSMPSTWLFVGHNNGDGTLNVSGNGSISALRLWVAGAFYGDNGTGTVNIDTTGTIVGTDGVMLGQAYGGGTASGTLNLTNGTITSGNELWVGSYGDSGSATGTLNQYGGAVSSAAWLVVGRENNAVGTYNLFGGTVTAATSTVGSFATLGGLTGSQGTLNVSGGSFTVAASRRLYVGEGGTATLNVSGTGTVTCSNIPSGGIVLGVNSGAAGTVNLNGGTLRAAMISKGVGSGNFYFNGGTLQAVASNTTFMQGLDAAYVLTNGAVIDTAANSITIAQPLFDGDGLGGGLTKTGNGTLTLNGGNNYTGSTTVNAGVLGGTGTIAGALTNSATLAPGDGGIGTLTINGNLTLNAGSTNVFEVDGTTPANDQVLAGANVTYGGVLKIVPSGTLTIGQTFTLFSGPGAVNAGNFASVQSTAGTYSFTNGVLTVVAVGPSGPGYITNSVSGNTLTLSWPAGQGWTLQTQTNSLTTGLGTNWVDVVGSTSISSTNITLNPAQPTVFYRLKY